jgi:putative nucleotidyltransferase with HDIG domain
MSAERDVRAIAFNVAAEPDAADIERVGEVLPELLLIEDAEARDLVARIWVHSWRCSDWVDPTDAFMTIGGLPEKRDPFKERWNQVAHTRAVVELAEGMVPTFERHVGCKVDRETLIVSILLHDVAKLIEYAPDQNGLPVKTPVGRVVHHATVGAQWALEAGFPPAVAHAIVAHSPSTSAKPETTEALVLKLADQVVTDINRMTTQFEAID